MLERLTHLDIITVCKDAAESLALTRDSIVMISKKIYVRWIVIDGSAHDECEYCVSLSGLERVIYKRGVDAGIYDAMNKGLKYVRSDYFMLLNAGDVILDKDMDVVVGKVNCYNSGWHDDVGNIIRVKKNYVLPWFGVMPNHQGMIFPLSYVRYSYNSDLKISSDFEIKLIAWAHNDLVLHDKVLVSSLAGGVSSTDLSLSRYLSRIKEMFVATSGQSFVMQLFVAFSVAVKSLRRIRFSWPRSVLNADKK